MNTIKVYDHNDIKEWYQATYPDDDLGERIYPGISWSDLWDHLLKGDDVYDAIGVGDSIVRERLFEELADSMGVHYDVVYYAWLDDYKKALQSLMNQKGDN